ncbi:uncharacterized protein VTP21DRAFT_10290 [Calcarisporiella thermophila]|uniref:uncharacterized protein n=1 Tax=Calcarisporiella thermophila TaxID=911321 RepID=UPI0037440919
MPEDKKVTLTIEKEQSKDFESLKQAERGKLTSKLLGIWWRRKNTQEVKARVPYIQLYRYASKLDRFLIVSILAGITQPLVAVSFGKLVQNFTSNSNPQTNSQGMTEAILILLWFGIALVVTSYASMCLWTLAGENQAKRIRELYFHAILRQDQGWFDQAESESLNSRLASDTFLIQEGLSDKVGLVIQNTTEFVTGFVAAFVFGWKLSVVLLVVVPLLGISVYSITNVIQFESQKAQNAYSTAGSIVEQAVSGIRTVAAFSLQSRFINSYEEKIDFAYRAGVRKALKSGAFLGLVMFTVYVSYAIGFLYGAHLISQGAMGAPEVMQSFFALLIGAFSIGQIGPNYKSLVEAQVAAHKIFATIDRTPPIDSLPPADDSGLTPTSCTGTITLQNVHFSYPTRPDAQVLRGIDLTIPSGKTVALVGASGSGKSTIIQLVQRFYDPNAGSIRIDGIDLRELNVRWLRNQIGIVGQEPVLFDDTIRNNIALGARNRNPTQEELEEVCRKANCHEMISKLPQGYDTLVGEKGSQLSGGQKQRIAIARALIRDPSILLLDEATSALDTKSEKLVQEALKAAALDRSTIIIAHRLSTIREADLIVVMEKGKIVEQGSHDELMAKQGAYMSYVNKQLLKTHEYSGITTEASPPGSDDSRNDESSEPESDLTKQPTIVVKSKRSPVFESKEEKRPLLRIVKMMASDWKYMAASVLGSAVVGAILPAHSLLLGRLFDAFGKPPAQVEGASRTWALMYFVLAVAFLIAGFFKDGVMMFCGERLVRRLRSRIFRNLLRQEIAFFDDPAHSTGALTASLAKDVTAVQEFPNAFFVDGGRTVATLVFGFVVMFSNGWKLTLYLLASMPFVALTMVFQVKSLQGFSGKTKKEYALSGKIVGEAIRGIRTVASLAAEDVFEKKYIDCNRKPHRAALMQAYVASIGYGLSQGSQFFIYALAFYLGSRLIASEEMTNQQVFTVAFAVVLTSFGMSHLSAHMPKVVKARQAAINLFELLDKTTTIDPEVDGKLEGPAPGTAALQNVTFAYPTRPEINIFENVSLDIQKNLKIALVGPSGSGKSTVIAHLLRWYDTTSGEALVEGANVRHWQLNAMRRRLALVGQEPVLFDLTVRENILYGCGEDEKVTQEDIEKAATNANIHHFITGLPNGYHTRVGENGSQLSGGQKQRIAIARALLRNPEILLLDEATSALDSESEKMVQGALNNAMIGRTTIAIAHRLSSIQDADLIVVLREGRVVEKGQHNDLIARGGVYSELANQQNLAS